MPDFQTAVEAQRETSSTTFEFPPGVVSDYFVCELALELGMTVGEVLDRMDLHELTVIWPAFFAARTRLAQIKAEEAS